MAFVNKCFEMEKRGDIVEAAYKEWKDPHRDVMFLKSSSCGLEEEVAVDRCHSRESRRRGDGTGRDSFHMPARVGRCVVSIPQTEGSSRQLISDKILK